MDMYTQDNMVGYQAAIAGKPAPTGTACVRDIRLAVRVIPGELARFHKRGARVQGCGARIHGVSGPSHRHIQVSNQLIRSD